MTRRQTDKARQDKRDRKRDMITFGALLCAINSGVETICLALGIVKLGGRGDKVGRIYKQHNVNRSDKTDVFDLL